MTETSYVVVVGSQTAFPGDKCMALGDIADDHENTILVVEVAGSGIHWMEPRDLHVTQMARAINPAKGQGISSHHHLGAHVVLADGGVQFLNAAQTTAEDIAAMLTIDGNEPSDRGAESAAKDSRKARRAHTAAERQRKFRKNATADNIARPSRNQTHCLVPRRTRNQRE